MILDIQDNVFFSMYFCKRHFGNILLKNAVLAE
jgi:hypothetical protein